MVDGQRFVFEPWGAEFVPAESGRVLIAFGDDATRHRGIEISLLDDGWVSVWMPARSEAFWLASASTDAKPWETDLTAIDYERGTLR
jgi:hypothetical protein